LSTRCTCTRARTRCVARPASLLLPLLEPAEQLRLDKTLESLNERFLTLSSLPSLSQRTQEVKKRNKK